MAFIRPFTPTPAPISSRITQNSMQISCLFPPFYSSSVTWYLALPAPRDPDPRHAMPLACPGAAFPWRRAVVVKSTGGIHQLQTFPPTATRARGERRRARQGTGGQGAANPLPAGEIRPQPQKGRRGVIRPCPTAAAAPGHNANAVWGRWLLLGLLGGHGPQTVEWLAAFSVLVFFFLLFCLFLSNWTPEVCCSRWHSLG
jgi:hypothetical protein